MSFKKVKLMNERRDEIRRLDACVAELRQRIRDLEDAIIVNAGSEEWAVTVLESGGKHRAENL